MDAAIPRNSPRHPTELSRLDSQREPGSISHNWQDNRFNNGRSNDVANVNGQLAAAVNRALKPRPMVGSMFPFKIYQLPIQYRTTPLADPSTAWRAFRVHGGLILNSAIDPTIDPPTGTDLIDNPWCDVFLTYTDGTFTVGVTDIIVPANQPNFYIWVDISAYSISYGSTPTSPTHGAAWASFPNGDPNFVMIGWVDTQTLLSQSRAIVRQVQFGDVTAAGGASSNIILGTINNNSGNPDIYANYFIISSGGSLKRVAKNYKLRNSITSATIDGNTWQYQYTTVIERTANTPSNASPTYTEYQRVSPRYLVGDPILAENVGNALCSGIVSVADTISGTPGAPVIYIDRNEDGRAWAANVNQGGP